MPVCRHTFKWKHFDHAKLILNTLQRTLKYKVEYLNATFPRQLEHVNIDIVRVLLMQLPINKTQKIPQQQVNF